MIPMTLFASHAWATKRMRLFVCESVPLGGFTAKK